MNLTAERLREVVCYCPETGQFRWRVTKSFNAKAGGIAGALASNGKGGRKYWRLSIDDKSYLAHRLAWLYVNGEWPRQCVDHIDGDGLNNAIVNLRQASKSQNAMNRGAQRNNSSGFKGVIYFKRDGKWQAQITKFGKPHHLGYYRTKEEAHAAYSQAAMKLHGEFARTE